MKEANDRHLTLVKGGKSDRDAMITRDCNLCKKPFRTDSKFVRFCDRCKRGDELFRFHESLPEAGPYRNIA